MKIVIYQKAITKKLCGTPLIFCISFKRLNDHRDGKAVVSIAFSDPFCTILSPLPCPLLLTPRLTLLSFFLLLFIVFTLENVTSRVIFSFFLLFFLRNFFLFPQNENIFLNGNSCSFPNKFIVN